MFLTKPDLYLKIIQPELAEITRGDDTLINTALVAAESEMRGWLFDTFDVDAIFTATGNERNPMLVDLGADIALYLLVARVQAGQDMADRQARYDRATAWLKASAKTELYNDLPRRVDTEQTHIVYGGLPKRQNRF
jgi:hypothetical protein